ncbi:MAG: hypothetical protein ACRD43_12910 [Pyrinomonadaceae bacterium]
MLRFLIFAVLAFSAYGQTSNVATSTRATNGKLISLSNIVGLSDCETKNFVGEVRKINVDGNLLHFQLWAPKKGENVLEKVKEKIKGRKKITAIQKIEVDLNRISAADRAVLFHDMIRKSFTVRVAGYSCGSSDVISAFSLDLVY